METNNKVSEVIVTSELESEQRSTLVSVEEIRLNTGDKCVHDPQTKTKSRNVYDSL